MLQWITVYTYIIRTCTHAHTRTHAHTHTYTNTHTHTQTHSYRSPARTARLGPPATLLIVFLCFCGSLPLLARRLPGRAPGINRLGVSAFWAIPACRFCSALLGHTCMHACMHIFMHTYMHACIRIPASALTLTSEPPVESHATSLLAIISSSLRKTGELLTIGI